MPRSKTIPVEDTIEAGRKVAKKDIVDNITETGLGSSAYSDRIMGELFSQPIGKKQELGRNKWADTALVLIHRAKKASQTYGKKDFNALYRLVLSAGIAFDKAFPQQVEPFSGNLVVQLFGSLGQSTAKAILEPAHPVIEVTTYKVDQPGSNDTEVEVTKDKPLD